jgi:hypothetical protein
MFMGKKCLDVERAIIESSNCTNCPDWTPSMAKEVPQITFRLD